MKNDTTFVRIRSGDHLWDAKILKKGTSLRRILTFLLIAIDTVGAEIKKKGWSTKRCLRFF